MTGPSGDGPGTATLDAARYQGRRLTRTAIRLLAGAPTAEEDAGALT